MRNSIGLAHAVALRLLAVTLLALAGCGGDETDGARDQAAPSRWRWTSSPTPCTPGSSPPRARGSTREHGLQLDVRAPVGLHRLAQALAVRPRRRLDRRHPRPRPGARARRGRGGGRRDRPAPAGRRDRPSGRPPPAPAGGQAGGVTGLPSDDAVLRAVVESDGGDFGAGAADHDRLLRGAVLWPKKVDAVVTFWNAEGVALRERGVRTREFRVDEFGAPRYPELVRGRQAEDAGRAPRAGRRARGRAGRRAPARLWPTAARPSARSPRSRAATRRWWRRSCEPWPRRSDRRSSWTSAQLRRWARFDERFGILERRPDVERAFAP